MKKKISVVVVLIISILIPSSAFCGNVALNADVTLYGSFFTGGAGWAGGYAVSEQTIVDGVFLPRSTQWNQGAVWWDSNTGASQYITIDLGGLYSIESFVVQADDNDAYKLFYWNGSDWSLAWDVPAVGGWGMQTRPNPLNNAEQYFLAAPIQTTMLKFMGNGSDYLYSVSEIQAYGTAVPEPVSILLLGLGLIGLAGVRKFRK